MRPLRPLLLALCLAPLGAAAGVTEPEARTEDAFDVKNVLADRGLHPLDDERWNAYGQLTWISSFKLPYAAAYTNLNGTNHSLSPNFEHSFTGTFTAYFGATLWKGAELYWVPEVISERPLTGLVGLGGVIQNFELQKQGAAAPTLYSSRFYLRQTFDLGGEVTVRDSDPMQLGGKVASRRLVLTVGNFSGLDFFDKNTFSGDLRRQFFNMAFLTYAAYDFAADARGYAWGAVAELYFDQWALRIARLTPPQHPNQLPLDFRFWQYYGDQLELEHQHTLFGRPGAVRLLGYRNQERMGRFDDAIAAFRTDPSQNAAGCTGFSYDSPNPGAPDLCWVRKTNVKVGVGLNVEQAVYEDIGLFLRAMWSDGQTEVYSFTSADRSLSFGALAKGSLWGRPHDFAGIGYGVGWISKPHADYLKLGGVDGFIGDGSIRVAPESVLEVFYSYKLLSIVWLSADYQYISNPAYNADRGPLHIFGVRGHFEF